jgi:hypothetical protein
VELASVGRYSGNAYLWGGKASLTVNGSRAISRWGSGPGETQGVGDVSETPRGEVLVMSKYQPRVERLSLDGRPTARYPALLAALGVGSRTVGDKVATLVLGPAAAPGADAAAALVLQSLGSARVDTAFTVRVAAASGEGTAAGRASLPPFFVAPPVWAPLDSSIFAVASGSAPVIQLINATDGRANEVVLPLTPRRVTPSELEGESRRLMAKTPRGTIFATAWQGDVRRRARDAARYHPVISELVPLRGRRVAAAVDAEGLGASWVLLDAARRTLAVLRGSVRRIGGEDAAGRLLLCTEPNDDPPVCGWSAHRR